MDSHHSDPKKFICSTKKIDSLDIKTIHADKLSDKRNAAAKIKVFFIQAVISSIYVEINQQNVFAVSCFEGISNFVQRYHQTGENQGRKLTSRMPSLS